jgi:hypothetical protein
VAILPSREIKGVIRDKGGTITERILQRIFLRWIVHYFGKCRYVDCQEEIIIPPRIFICERWKSINQAAIRGLLPHEIFSLNAKRCRTLNYEVL